MHAEVIESGPCASKISTIPLRIGVWCDFGIQLSCPWDWRGYVANLVAAMLEEDEGIEMVMLIREGGHQIVPTISDSGAKRLKVIPIQFRWLSIPWAILMWHQ